MHDPHPKIHGHVWGWASVAGQGMAGREGPKREKVSWELVDKSVGWGPAGVAQ